MAVGGDFERVARPAGFSVKVPVAVIVRVETCAGVGRGLLQAKVRRREVQQGKGRAEVTLVPKAALAIGQGQREPHMVWTVIRDLAIFHRRSRRPRMRRDAAVLIGFELVIGARNGGPCTADPVGKGTTILP